MSGGNAGVRHYRWWLTGAALLSVVVRVRFVFSPINADEGGFLAIARAWRHGADLYGDVWVDRPQGTLLVYRLYDVLGGGEDRLRIIALAFGAVAVVAVAQAVRAVSSQRAALVAAVATAVLTASPAIEGYSANGELLSGTFGAASVAVACTVLVGRRPGPWMMAAGALGGLAWSVKQSGIDGPVAVGVWIVLAAVAGWLPWRTAAVRFAQLAAGTLVVLGLCALHGALTGWSDWWYAIIRYRSEQRSAFIGAKWSRLDTTGWDALRLFGPALVAAAVAGWVARSRHVRVFAARASWVLPIWLVTASLTFMSGGQFFHHYWVIVAFPVSALCGLAIGAVPNRSLVAAFAAVALVPALVGAATLAAHPRHEIAMAINNEPRPLIAERVGHFIRDHKAPGDSYYALCAAAHSYAHAGIDPPYRYLWIDGVFQGEGSRADLHDLFTGAAPPTWVAAFDDPTLCDPDGVVARSLITEYTKVATVDGVGIYHVRE